MMIVLSWNRCGYCEVIGKKMIHLDDIRNSWLTAFLIDSFIFYKGYG